MKIGNISYFPKLPIIETPYKQNSVAVILPEKGFESFKELTGLNKVDFSTTKGKFIDGYF